MDTNRASKINSRKIFGQLLSMEKIWEKNFPEIFKINYMEK